MDIYLFAVLSICGIFGSWRLYAWQQQRGKQEVLRERVAWMLWLAADQKQSH